MRRQTDTASSRSSRRVNPVDHSNSDQSSAAAAVAEKVLPNGDLYVGAFSRGRPHGPGKYLWRDGCTHDGHWRRGRADGAGRLSWPSGATYEGDFRSGRMEGLGTLTGPGGATYRGSWSAGRKHGHGSRSYANGDLYEGAWRLDLPHGRGLYAWRCGSRYDGHWEDGAPKGSGVFTWPDGCCYIGSWTKDRFSNGMFYSPVVVAAVDGRRRRSSEENNFPRICIWDFDGEAGDITCDIVDNLEAASMLYRSSSSVVKVFDAPMLRTGGGEAKKPGQTISKGHKNYDLMINLQLGIAYSVGKATRTQMRGLRPEDFDPREKYWTRFPTEGSKTTPPHQSIDFRWKDYCPLVFRHLRKLFAVDPGDYMMAICGSDALRELSSPGKSGSFFYLTQDGRFMIKTVKKSEAKVLIRMLPCYYKHMFLYENSLVTKFFSVHCVKPFGGQKVRFVVMGNLFCSEHQIHRRFDLKGSSYGRTTDKTEEETDETTTLKDLDLNFVFHLQRPLFLELLRQIDRDCHFLEAVGIMDYSLLVGLHFRDDISASKLTMSPYAAAASPRNCGKRNSFHWGNLTSEYSFTEPDRKDPAILDTRKPTRLGSNMPARAEHLSRKSGLESYPLLVGGGGGGGGDGGGGLWLPSQYSNEIYDVVLYCGIIDILQDYDISKKLEHAYKSLQVDPSSISAVDPKLYSRRFRDFIGRVFVDDT